MARYRLHELVDACIRLTDERDVYLTHTKRARRSYLGIDGLGKIPKKVWHLFSSASVYDFSAVRDDSKKLIGVSFDMSFEGQEKANILLTILKRGLGPTIPLYLYGARIEDERDSKKDTQDVQESSPKESEQNHGGDGNAQEVDHHSESKDENASSEDGLGENDDSLDIQNVDSGNQGEGKGEGGSGESDLGASLEKEGDASGSGGPLGQESNGSSITLGESLDLSNGGSTSKVEANNRKSRCKTFKTRITKTEDPKNNGMSNARFLVGGNRQVSKKDIDEMVKIIKKVFTTMCGNEPNDDITGFLQSPRFSGQAVIKEMLTKRFNINRMRREELDAKPKKILLCADTSGSCSSSSGFTTAVCQKLAEVNSSFIYVEHINGEPLVINEEGNETEVDRPDRKSQLQFWDNLSNRKDIVGSIFFGDFDGIDLWSIMWAHKKAILLDSYMCKKLDTPILTNPSSIKTWYGFSYDGPAKNLLYYIGVNSSYKVMSCLRKACRYL